MSLAKGLVPPDGTPPTVALERAFGPERTACVGGPAHAREMVESGAGLVCASHSEALAHRVAEVFQRSGVVCEVSDDPVGVELAGVAKNAAAVAVGATQAQGLNAAGMAAADIFLEVLALAELSGGKARTFVGRGGTGDLVATALAPTSRNRSAGELLAEGVPAAEIPDRLGQAVEALETVRLLAHAIERAGLEAPVTSALARLIDGTLPLDDWIELVRAKQPPPARFGRPRTWWARLKAWFTAPPSAPSSRLVRAMKTEIHPEYVEAHVRCTCGNEFTTRSTEQRCTSRSARTATRSTRASRSWWTPAAASSASAAAPPAARASPERATPGVRAVSGACALGCDISRWPHPGPR